MTIQTENNEVARALLGTKLFLNPHRKQGHGDFTYEKEVAEGFNDIWPRYGIELIIRPECNQKCKYCYIAQRGEKLYPPEKRLTREQILHNVKMLMDYLQEQECYIRLWELFAGDLFYDDLYFDLMDIMYPYFENMYNKNPQFFENGIRAEIITPSNFSMLVPYDERINRLNEYTERFRKIHVVLGFSWSTDGPYGIEYREGKNPKINEEYWDKAFKLVSKNGYGIHPMISFENIDNAIRNYDWFIEMCEKHLSADQWSPSFLEVRNPEDDGWTDENITKYLEFLNHIIQVRLEKVDYDLVNFALNISGVDVPGAYHVYNNDLITLYPRARSENSPTCGQDMLLMLNMSDLTFYPCHRLTYPQFAGITFATNEENTKITGVEAGKNLSLYTYFTNRNIMLEPGCVNCEARYICMHGCCGAQYEYSGEPFLPVPRVCRLLKAKYAYLAKTYHEMGVLDLILNDDTHNYRLNGERRENLISYLQKMGYNYE